MNKFNKGEGITNTENPNNVHPKYVDKHGETHETALHQQPGSDLRTESTVHQVLDDNLNKIMTKNLMRQQTPDIAAELMQNRKDRTVGSVRFSRRKLSVKTQPAKKH